jgi:hypothetical protein
MAQRFDVRRLALVGEATPVADHVQTNGMVAPIGSFSASETGVLAYQAGSSDELGTQITWLDRTGHTIGTVGPRRPYFDLEVSPDGKQATVSSPRAQGGDATCGSSISFAAFLRGSRFRLAPRRRQSGRPTANASPSTR